MSRKNIQEVGCRLCEAINNPFTTGELRACDTVLFSTRNFVLLPSIGPLVCGHAMVVSRSHYPSLASMPEENIREYENMVRMFFSSPELQGNLLEAEHGSTTTCNAGACVAHTHIHLLPGLQDHFSFMDGILTRLETYRHPGDMRQSNEPYIFVRRNLSDSILFAANEVPTQMIRQVLCKQLRQINWNWRLDARESVINETVTFWKTLLAHVTFA